MKVSAGSYRFSWFDWFCLWYPPGWLILFNRHWQHYRPDPDGWNGLEYLLFLLPGGFYLALLMRWLRLGMRSPSAVPTPPDPEYQQAFRDEILNPIVQRYFRAELAQLENLPSTGPLIVLLNHAGMCFPWDFLGLGLLLSHKRDWFVRPLAHPLFFDHPWLVWWLPPGWTEVLGGVRAEKDSLEQAVAEKNVLLYAPESWRGLAKGWQNRHQLATFDPSFIRMSDRYQVPVLPVLCLGNEYLHPWAFNLKWLAQRFKLPMFPISPLILAFIFFPSMGVWVMPGRLRYYVQPLVYPWKQTEAILPGQTPRWSVAYQQAKCLQMQLQKQLNHLLDQFWKPQKRIERSP